MVKREGKFWVLRSRRGGRVLGRHRSKRQAERQETAIRLSRLRREGRIPPRER